MLGIEGFGFVGIRRAVPSFRPPHVAAFLHRDGIAAAFNDDDRLDGGRVVEGLVDAGLELDDFATAKAAIGGNHELGLTIVDPILDRFGAEAAKNHGMNRPDARAGEHGDHRLRNHRQVERNPIPGTDAHIFKDVRQTTDVKVELLISDRADVARLALEDQRRLVFARGAQVTVDAIFGHVEFTADKPFRVGRLPIEDFLEGFSPDKLLFGLSTPEFFWAIDRFIIEPFVGGFTPKISLGFELGRRPE